MTYICEHCGTIYFAPGVCDWGGKELAPYDVAPTGQGDYVEIEHWPSLRAETGYSADYEEIERNEFLGKDAA